MLFVVSAFSILIFIYLFIYVFIPVLFCVSPVPFSVTSLYSNFFVCYFCPGHGVCNLVCFQRAHNFTLFPLIKLSYKPVGGVSALLTTKDAMPEIPIPDDIPCLYRVGSCSHCY